MTSYGQVPLGAWPSFYLSTEAEINATIDKMKYTGEDDTSGKNLEEKNTKGCGSVSETGGWGSAFF